MNELGADTRILITGGTGSFGQELVKTLFARWPEIRRIVVYSRDELKQFWMQERYPPENTLRYDSSLATCVMEPVWSGPWRVSISWSTRRH